MTDSLITLLDFAKDVVRLVDAQTRGVQLFPREELRRLAVKVIEQETRSEERE